MSPDRLPGPRASIPLAALAIVALASIGPAQERIRMVELDPQPVFEVDRRHFDARVFGNIRNADAAREELDAQIEVRINEIERDCALSNEQAEKLKLAARGDVERFFARVNQKRDQMQGKSFDRDKINEAFQELQSLQQEYQAGLFGDDALLTKVIATILDDEQAARHEEVLRERQAFRYLADVEMFIARMGDILGLTDAQRSRFSEAILEGTRPPRRLPWIRPYDQFLVPYQISTLPDETLRPIFDDAQWQVLRNQIDQAARMAPALRAQGLIDDDEDPE